MNKTGYINVVVFCELSIVLSLGLNNREEHFFKRHVQLPPIPCLWQGIIILHVGNKKFEFLACKTIWEEGTDILQMKIEPTVSMNRNELEYNLSLFRNDQNWEEVKNQDMPEFPL